MLRLLGTVVAWSAVLVAFPAGATNWQGGSGTGWATGANWQGGVAPTNGAGGVANFAQAGAPLASNVTAPWKLTQLSLLNFNWAITGETITFGSGGLLTQSGGAPTIANTLNLDVNAGSLTVNNAGALTLPSITGFGPVVKEGAGTLTIGNVYIVGSVTVNAGTVVSSPNAGPDITVNGNLTTHNGMWGSLAGTGNVNATGVLFLNQDNDATFSGNLTIQSNLNKGGPGKLTLTGANSWGYLLLPSGTVQIGNGISGNYPNNSFVYGGGALILNTPGTANVRCISDTVSLQVLGGNVVQTGTNVSGCGWDSTGPITVSGGSLTNIELINVGSVTVSSPGTWTAGNSTVASLSGNGAITASGAVNVGHSGGDSTFNGNLSGNGPLNKVGAGTFTLTGAVTTTIPTIVHGGTLRLQGAVVSSAIGVPIGGRLSGYGTVLSAVHVDAGATLAPESLTLQALYGGGTFAFAIDGLVAGSQHGQVVLQSAPVLDGSTLSLVGGHVATPGQSFTLIRNDGPGAPVGTFAGLPEGAVLTFNGAPLKITYVGGSGGNDVVLSYAQHGVAPSVAGNGTILPGTTQAVLHNATAQFTLTAAVDHHLVSVGGTCGGLLAGNVFTTSAVIADCTVIANFAIDTRVVTPSAGPSGTISPSSPVLVNLGSTTQFTLTPAAGHTAAVGGTCPVGTLVGNLYTTGAITANCTVAATFTLNTQSVTASSGANGTVAPLGAQSVNYGATLALTVLPDTGYSASVGGTCPAGSLLGAAYTTGTITGDCTVSITFTLNTYAVTPSAGPNGSISPASAQNVGHGSTRQFTVTPAANYFASMGGTCPAGTLVGTLYTTGPITTNCTVTVEFTLNTYTVTPSANAFGTISPGVAQAVSHGATLQFTVTPAIGHTVSMGGTCGGALAGNIYTTAAVTGNCTVVATFAANQYIVTPIAGTNGTISPATPQSVSHGSTLQLTVTPSAGYRATIGGTCPAGILAGSVYTTGAIGGDCNVLVTFAIAYAQYNLFLEGFQQAAPYLMTSASGSGTALYNPITRQLALAMDYVFVSENGAHVHGPAPRGQNAPVLFDLPAGSPKAAVITLTPEQEVMLFAGQLYVDIHAIGYPAGQLRAQIDHLGATVLHTLTVTVPPAPGLIQGGTEAGNNLVHCEATFVDGCSLLVPHGAIVQLMGFSGASGYVAQWAGDCSGTGVGQHCVFAMDGDKAISATFVSSGVDLSSTLTAAPNPAVPGQDVTFTATAHNAGPNVSIGTTVYVEFPAGIAFVSAGAGCADYNFDGEVFVGCEAGNLAAGASRQFTFVLRPTTVGTFAITSDASGDQADYNAGNEGQTVQLVVNTPTVNPTGRVVNISTRMQVLTGDDVMIGGIVIGGGANKTVVVRARGPSLADFGIVGTLANPQLQLFSGSTVIAANDDWQQAANEAQLQASGFAPANAQESAILMSLAPGAYTAIVSGVGGATGVGIVEVFEVDEFATPLINIATRGRVQTGDNVMIAGFIIQGDAPQTVVVRARGPSLSDFGIASPLANPQLQLFSGPAVIAANDDWQQAANVADVLASGFAPANAQESAILITLQPGAYTAIVSGVGGTTGVAIVEVFRN